MQEKHYQTNAAESRTAAGAKPVIAVTVSQGDGRLMLSHNCETAIVAAGGLPVLLPVHIDPQDAAALLARCDGIVFSGGPDMDPAYFGEEVLAECGGIDIERDRAEAAYFAAARELGLPIFGICRGHQLINVLLGGDLYQDIDAQLPRSPALQHRSHGAGDTLLHTIRTEPDSLLARITHGEALRVTSTHHQAVRRIAPGLRAVGFSADGVVEALEGDGGAFLLSVQWHPELRYTREAHALALFEALTDAARRYREARHA